MVQVILQFLSIVVIVMYASLVFAKAEKMDEKHGWKGWKTFFDSFITAMKNPF